MNSVLLSTTGYSSPIKAFSSDILPAGTKLLEFEITELIGKGGFGIIYRAYDRLLQRDVAIKEYMPAALAKRGHDWQVTAASSKSADTFQAGMKSFINEARLLAQFDHPSLLKVYRFWEANGTAYMAMPFYEGITLKQTFAAAAEPPSQQWLTDLLRALLDALDQLHRGQCFHRDIAPDNILILKNGRPLLLDFGAARHVIGEMTHALTAILKPGYAPVEQYADELDIKQGAWTDIYALAAVMYRAITGKVPVASTARLITDPLKPLAVVAAGRYSDAFLRGIDRALAVRPEDRPQSVAELRTLLGLDDRRQTPRASEAPMATSEKAIQEDSTETTQVMSRPVPAPVKGKRTAVIFALAVPAAIALAGAAWFFLLHPQQPVVKPTVKTPDIVNIPAPCQPKETPPVPSIQQEAAPPAADTLPTAPARPSGLPDLPQTPVAVPEKKEKLPAKPDRVKPGNVAAASPVSPVSNVKRPASLKIPVSRCSDILQRASLGEPLTQEETTILRRNCR
jgi:serine/threonine protein kinase